MKVKLKALRGFALLATFSYQSYATLAYGFLGDNSALRSTMIGVTVLLCLIGLSRCKMSTLIFAAKSIVGYALIFGIAYFFHPQNRVYILDMVSSSFIWLFLIIFTYELSEDELDTWISRTAFVILFCNAFELAHHYVTSQHDGYMVYGMRVLICIVMFCYLYFRTKKKKYLVGYLIASILIFTLGGRSAFLICVILFCMGYVKEGGKASKAVYRSALLGIAICVLYFASSAILRISATVLDNMGISSRTLLKILEGSVSDDNGRYIIWGNAISRIRSGWVFGYGIGGDRTFVLIGAIYGYYVHNFVLELLIDFGVIIGSAIVIMIMIAGVKVIIHDECASQMSSLFTYIFIAAFIKLFFSSSLWIDIMTYWCLAVYFRYYKEARLAKKSFQSKER